MQRPHFRCRPQPGAGSLQPRVSVVSVIEIRRKPIFSRAIPFWGQKPKARDTTAQNLLLEIVSHKRDVDVVAPEVIEPSVTPSSNPPDFDDPNLVEFFLKTPDTPVFARQFFERLRESPSGELDPIVHLFVEFVREFCPKNADRQETGKWFFMHARSVLGAPEDTDLSDRIASAIDEKLAESVG